MFGRDQQQPAAGAEDLVLPEHPAGQEGEHAAGLHAGDPRADRGRHRAGAAALLLGERVDQRVEQRGHAVGVGVDPARPVHDRDLGRRAAGHAGAAR